MDPPSTAPLTARLLEQLAAQDQHSPGTLGQPLEQALEQLLQRARGVPGMEPPQTNALLDFVAHRLPPGCDLVDTLEQLHVEDLTLAFLCTAGDEQAMATMERQHFEVIQVALARMPDAAAQREEITQQLRQRLFVGEQQRPPKISQYAGRGDLRSWLRVAAVRCAIDMLRLNQREVELGPRILEDLTAPGEDPEIDHLKRMYHAEFKKAFEDVLASLSSRDRNVLRYHFIQQLNIDQIGAIHGVHRSTVARWLASLRENLLVSTRKALAHRLRVGGDEVESIMRLIRSQLDASIERIL